MESAGFHHPLVRAARALHVKKHRTEQRSFLIEGPIAVASALDAPDIHIERVFFHGAGADQAGGHVMEKAAARAATLVSVDERTIRSLSQTREPQGVVAVARFFHREIGALASALPDDEPCVALVLHAIADPGNAGTLVRSAEAFRVSAVCWGRESVDPYNDKVVRSSMGSLFHVPLFVYDEWPALAGAAQRASLAFVGAEAGAPDVRQVTPPARTALIVGHERRGLAGIPPGPQMIRVGIPQAARPESLNAAVAGSIVLYEIARATGVLERAARTTTS